MKTSLNVTVSLGSGVGGGRTGGLVATGGGAWAPAIPDAELLLPAAVFFRLPLLHFLGLTGAVKH